MSFFDMQDILETLKPTIISKVKDNEKYWMNILYSTLYKPYMILDVIIKWGSATLTGI